MNDARYSMAVLYERRIIGEEPGTARYDIALRQAASELDAIARLATHPETAPAVFAWLVEAGVLAKTFNSCRCRGSSRTWFSHYHAAMDHEKASGVGT